MADTSREHERSQPLMRLPRDKTPGELITIDGERTFAQFFVPQGDGLARVFDDTSAFMPVAIGPTTRLIRRDTIACITAHVLHAGVLESELPEERQRAIIRLRGGAVVRGELRWVAQYGFRRTLDHLNDTATQLIAHDDDHVHFMAKSAVLSVEEY